MPSCGGCCEAAPAPAPPSVGMLALPLGAGEDPGRLAHRRCCDIRTAARPRRCAPVPARRSGPRCHSPTGQGRAPVGDSAMSNHRWSRPTGRGDDPRTCKRCGVRRRTVRTDRGPGSDGESPRSGCAVYQLQDGGDWTPTRPPCPGEPVSLDVSRVDVRPIIGRNRTPPPDWVVQLDLDGRPSVAVGPGGTERKYRDCPVCGTRYWPFGKGSGRPAGWCSPECKRTHRAQVERSRRALQRRVVASATPQRPPQPQQRHPKTLRSDTDAR